MLSTIEQMNTVIAAFERRIFYNKYTIDDYGPHHGLKYPYMHYHEKWDNWLMPVVEMIESTYDDFHGYFGVHICSNSCIIQGTKLNTRPGQEHYAYFNEVVLESKIAATHYAVYIFIVWYNENLKK